MNPKTREERLVVVGGCAAGMSAASKARRLNPQLEIVALEKSAFVSFAACGIPYYVADLVRHHSNVPSFQPLSIGSTVLMEDVSAQCRPVVASVFPVLIV